MNRLRCLVFVLVAALPLLSQLREDQRRRIETLQKRLLAPCCYTENVAQHRSEAADAMRAEIREMVLAGRTEREILDHYKQRYGARILSEPEGPVQVWGYAVPLAMLVFGCLVVLRLILRWRAVPQTPGVSS